MEDPELDPNNLPIFKIPESFLDKLMEFTSTESTPSKGGFILACVNQVGAPVVITRADCQITEMGLRKALEQFLEDTEETQIIDYGGEELT